MYKDVLDKLSDFDLKKLDLNYDLLNKKIDSEDLEERENLSCLLSDVFLKSLLNGLTLSDSFYSVFVLLNIIEEV